jgi:uncharacterized protein YjiS (DUF1127 family)
MPRPEKKPRKFKSQHEYRNEVKALGEQINQKAKEDLGITRPKIVRNVPIERT